MQEFEEEGKGAAGPTSRRNQSELFLVPQDSASTSPRFSFDRTDEEHQAARGAKSAEAALAVDRVEIERLRGMLRQQEQATLQAIEKAADLQTKLSSAETEVVKIGQQYHGFSKQSGSNNARKDAEIAS